MGKDLIEGLVSILAAVVGIALIAVIVAKGSQTGQVLSSGGTAFANILRAAEGH